MIEAGIIGGSGYSGGELLRLLSRHPEARIKWVTSRSDAKLRETHKNLYAEPIEFIKPEEAEKISCDVVFLCLPAGTSMKYARRFIEKGTKVIDISADFRLKNLELYEKVYKVKHVEPELVKEAVYGTTELHRKEIAKCRVLANPGCYSNTTILALAPLAKTGLVDLEHIVVDAKSGSSGAGTECSLYTHHSEGANSMFPYNVIKHRHTYEIEQEIELLAGKKTVVNFTPYYTPFIRGILSSSHVFLKKNKDREHFLELYKKFYANEKFVQVLDIPKKGAGTEYVPYPSVSNVYGSNYCQIGLDVDDERGRLVVFATIDNLMKGAAGQAIQNMNAMFGIKEDAGINMLGLHPA